MGEIVRLFTDDTSDGLAKAGLEWTRKEDERIGGQPCYVLAGTVKLQNVLVWINRKTFLIAQTQVVLDANGHRRHGRRQNQGELKAQNNGKEPTLLQIANVKKLLKTTGTVTETYGNIQTNLTFAMTDIEPPAPVAPVAATPAPAPAARAGPSGGAAARAAVAAVRAAVAVAGGGRRGQDADLRPSPGLSPPIVNPI